MAEPGFRAPIGTRIGYLVSTEAEQADLRAPVGGGRMMDDEQLARRCREMVRIRLFEERVRREFGKGDMPGFVHTVRRRRGGGRRRVRRTSATTI